ncbi:MAG: S46 family peptidase [Candidatus Eisenbacteria bacterium]|nr:S46 family peptidase [Candidatus Eisenbacteria bacterium]
MSRTFSAFRPPALQRALVVATLIVTSAFASPAVRADEGMWTFDNLPLAKMQQRYGFTPTPEWIAHVQKASVHFGGASGAFVSPDGLVLTNHHVGLGQLQKLSSPKADFVKDGFFARTRAEELRCPDLELNVLLSMEEVTARVTAAIDPAADARKQNAQRKSVSARIEKEATEKTKLRCRVVELYHGGEYWLYRYRKYTDVRLVMAPEQQAAFYGGDPDNFCYPRHDLDMTFFRVYENGQPVRPADYLKWNTRGPGEGDLVFVSGHPGSTSRLKTVAELEYERDGEIPERTRIRERQLAAYREYEARGAEQARQAQDRIFGLENSLKRLRGYLEALQGDPVNRHYILQEKRQAEDSLRSWVARDPKLSAECVGAWDRIAAAEKEMMRRNKEYQVRTGYLGGRLLGFAGDIVRMVAETSRPNDQRLEEYRDSHLESVKYQLFSKAPVYPAMEEYLFAVGLEECLKDLGPEDPWVKLALGGMQPAEVAHELFAGTRLADVAFRRELVQGGRKAVEASTDPLVTWTRRMDGMYRDLRSWYEENVTGVESLEGAKIARARFAMLGKSTYPDATGTLRLTYGKVAGYRQLTTRVPWKTTFLGLYDRAESFDNQPPFQLPARVAAGRAKVDLSTPLDFVTTNDIIGGNSGSPVLNKNAEFVGLVFDGNVQAFQWSFDFDEVQGRTVAVHPAAIVESLRHIYDMGALADELEGAGR